MFNWIRKIFTEKKYIISKNKYKYYEVSYNEIPKWVHNAFKKNIVLKSGSDIDIEDRSFYFKGKTYRYIIRTGMAMGQGAGFSIKEYKYYKRRRTGK